MAFQYWLSANQLEKRPTSDVMVNQRLGDLWYPVDDERNSI
jgi:hypothetical protein